MNNLGTSIDNLTATLTELKESPFSSEERSWSNKTRLIQGSRALLPATSNKTSGDRPISQMVNCTICQDTGLYTIVCTVCRGFGGFPGPNRMCDTCHGDGIARTYGGWIAACQDCHGRGVTETWVECHACHWIPRMINCQYCRWVDWRHGSPLFSSYKWSDSKRSRRGWWTGKGRGTPWRKGGLCYFWLNVKLQPWCISRTMPIALILS